MVRFCGPYQDHASEIGKAMTTIGSKTVENEKKTCLDLYVRRESIGGALGAKAPSKKKKKHLWVPSVARRCNNETMGVTAYTDSADCPRQFFFFGGGAPRCMRSVTQTIIASQVPFLAWKRPYKLHRLPCFACIGTPPLYGRQRRPQGVYRIQCLCNAKY